MLSVRHRHSAINRSGIVLSILIELYKYIVANNLKGEEKAKIKYLRMRMVVSDNFQVIYNRRNRINDTYFNNVVRHIF